MPPEQDRDLQSVFDCTPLGKLSGFFAKSLNFVVMSAKQIKEFSENSTCYQARRSLIK
jgi:hypothetical protein